LQVDDQLELGGALNGQIAGLLAFEDAAGIDAGLAMGVELARTIAH
jgi:hypothetical protein